MDRTAANDRRQRCLSWCYSFPFSQYYSAPALLLHFRAMTDTDTISITVEYAHAVHAVHEQGVATQCQDEPVDGSHTRMMTTQNVSNRK